MRLIAAILFILISSCSSLEKRAPASGGISIYEDKDYFIMQFQLLLEPNNRVFTVELPVLESADYDLSSVKLDYVSSPNVKCTTDEQRISSCKLSGNSSEELVVRIKLKKFKKFPIYESSWKVDPIKRLFSYDENQISKIKAKIDSKAKLFLTDKQFLLNTFGEESEVILDASKRDNLKVQMELGDILSIEKIRSDLYLDEWGEFGFEGIRSYAVTNRFQNKEVQAFAFFCETKNTVYELSYGSILISNNEDKVNCLLNLKKAALFRGNDVSGELNFSLKILRMKDTEEKINKTLAQAQQRLAYYLNALNLRNKTTLSQALDESYQDFSKNSTRKYTFF